MPLETLKHPVHINGVYYQYQLDGILGTTRESVLATKQALDAMDNNLALKGISGCRLLVNGFVPSIGTGTRAFSYTFAPDVPVINLATGKKTIAQLATTLACVGLYHFHNNSTVLDDCEHVTKTNTGIFSYETPTDLILSELQAHGMPTIDEQNLSLKMQELTLDTADTPKVMSSGIESLTQELSNLTINLAIENSLSTPFDNATSRRNTFGQVLNQKIHSSDLIGLLKFDARLGILDSNTRNDIITINAAVQEINRQILEGGNPAVEIDALLTHLLTDENTARHWSERKAKRHESDREFDYVTCEQWDDRFSALREFTGSLQAKLTKAQRSYYIANGYYQQLSSVAIGALGNYVGRFGTDKQKQLMANIELAQQFVPSVFSMSLQLPSAIARNDIVGWTEALGRQVTKQYCAVTNPFGSVNKLSTAANFALVATRHSPLAKAYPDEIDAAAKAVAAISYTATGVNAWKAYKAYQAGAAVTQLAAYGTLVIDFGVDAAVHYVTNNTKGNLLELPEDYALKDGTQWAIALALPPNPVTGFFIVTKMITNAYNIISGEYSERAYQAMMSNAAHHWNAKNFGTAWQSINHLIAHMHKHHAGLNYQESDSPVVKQAKVFINNMEIQERYQKFFDKVQSDSPFPQEEYDFVTRASEMADFRDPKTKKRGIPIRELPNTMLQYLQLLVTGEQIAPKKFRKIFNVIFEQITTKATLQSVHIAQFKNGFANLAKLFRSRLAIQAWESRESDSVKSQKLARHFTKSYAGQSNISHDLDPAILYILGSTRLQHGDYLKAIYYFESIADNEKDKHWESWYEMGEAIRLLTQNSENEQGRAALNALSQLCFINTIKALQKVNESTVFQRDLLHELSKTTTLPNEHEQQKHLTLQRKVTEMGWSTAILAILRKQTLTGNKNGIHYVFAPHPVPADGDCALHALGLTRKQIVKQLLEHKDKESIRKMVADDILAGFVSGGKGLPDELKDETYLRLKSNFDASGVLSGQIIAWANNPAIFETFIKHFVATPGRWLEYPLKQEGTSSTLDAIAILNNINLTIWQREQPNKAALKPVFERFHSADGKNVHMFHTNTEKGQSTSNLNHFNLLIVTKEQLDDSFDLSSTKTLRFLSDANFPAAQTLTPSNDDEQKFTFNHVDGRSRMRI